MKKLFFILLIICVAGCKEKYDLPFEQPDTGYLVIEGMINAGQDVTRIELSRTNKINSTLKQFEQKALVQVEGDDNSVEQLFENTIGNYTGQLHLNSSKQYRLRIKTEAGKEYLSDFVGVKVTPPIDSISWERENDGGVRIHFNTHDHQNATRYYRWDYVETWEFHSSYRSFLKYTPDVPSSANGSVGYRDSSRYEFDSSIFKCWQSVASSSILLGSSARLSSDVIYKLPFLFIPQGDKKISELYSIYVRQYALTKEAYEFYEKMKKNTEENGSIFDPQPSQLKGNIRCVSAPEEQVVGFISVGTVSEKRIFIRNSDVPFWNYRSGCRENKIRNHPDSVDVARTSGQIPTVVIEQSPIGGFIIYFGAANPNCVDCTLTGTNVKPAFWP
jgi:hypothetical protein